MITDEGYFDWMTQEPGPPDKRYSERNAADLFIPHSMVGRMNGWRSRLHDLSKDASGRYTLNAAASVTGSVLLDGTAIQHYSIFVSCWASGWRTQNIRGITFEHESEYSVINGLYQPDERVPFSRKQVATDLRIIEDVVAFKKRHGIPWVPLRPPVDDLLNPADKYTLRTHSECVKIWGGGATACESGRAKPLWDLIDAGIPDNVEDEMLSLALLKVSGTFLDLVSDVEQGFPLNPTWCAEILSLIGDGPQESIVKRQQARGLLLYSAGEAARGVPLNSTATKQVRFLCKNPAAVLS